MLPPMAMAARSAAVTSGPRWQAPPHVRRRPWQAGCGSLIAGLPRRTCSTRLRETCLDSVHPGAIDSQVLALGHNVRATPGIPPDLATRSVAEVLADIRQNPAVTNFHAPARKE